MVRNKKGQFVKGENINDISGKRFGRLTVMELDKSRTTRKSYWICRCDCGNIKSIRADTLKYIISCGCEKKKQDIINLGIERNHNMTHHVLFPVWDSMMSRCYNKNNRSYKNYGARGITVCDEWKIVENFISWAESNGYKNGLTIERINVNGNYEPSNCTWIPPNEQSLNTTRSVYIDCKGKRIPLARTAREYGLSPSLVWHRWKRGITDFDKLFFVGNLRTGYKA